MSAPETTINVDQAVRGGALSVKVDAAASEYVILERTGTGWTERKEGTVTARSAETAIRRAVGTPTAETAGIYVAIPLRSWKPIEVEAKVETTLVLKEAN